VNVACFGGGAEQRGVSAAKATTLGKPLGVGYTAPPAGEGVPYDNFVVRLADEDAEAVTTAMKAVVAAQRHGELHSGDAVRWV
jgi:hypothetical protein